MGGGPKAHPEASMAFRHPPFALSDLSGGITAMLVAIPSAIAYGILIYSPLGAEWTGAAAFSAMVGVVFLATLAAFFGGAPKLISAPCAPAAATLSVFVAALAADGHTVPAMVPVYLGMAAAGAGVLQYLTGRLGGGKIIKYIPYPVVAGYLSGVGVLILIAQIPKWLGTPKSLDFVTSLISVSQWRWEGIVVGAVTLALMILSPKVLPKVPAAIVALTGGVAAYFTLAAFVPSLLQLEHNKLIVGPVPGADAAAVTRIADLWTSATRLTWTDLQLVLSPMLTLAALLSIDTLKTCVVVDAMTRSRHDSNRTLVGQGLGNFFTGLFGGVPGAGTMGPTMVNLNSGGVSRWAGVIAGVSALVVVLALGWAVAWIPVSALAGILIVLALRMIDWHSLSLARHRSTRFDLAVILAVIVTAVTTTLILAAAVGIGLAIILFLREQMRTSVIWRRATGAETFSKRTRPLGEIAVLEQFGAETLVVEVQGQLFFGTTDKLYTEVEPSLESCRHLLLDLRRVRSVDYTAAHLFHMLRDALKKHGGTLALVSVPRSSPSGANPQSYLQHLGIEADGESIFFFAEMDDALTWAEERTLEAHGGHITTADQALDVGAFDLFAGLPPLILAEVSTLLENRHLEAGEYAFHQGDTGREVYFLRRGSVRIRLALPGDQSLHLATFGQGAFFGDMAFLDHAGRSADAVAERPTDLYVLRREAFDRLAQTHPRAEAHFFERLSLTLSTRLRQSHAELKALREG